MPRGVFVLYFLLWGVKYGSFCRAARSLAVPVRQHGGGLLCLREGQCLRIFVWEARQRARLTLQQLEHKTGISRSTLNRIENGQTVPRLDQLEAIAAATDTRITALFDSPFK